MTDPALLAFTVLSSFASSEPQLPLASINAFQEESSLNWLTPEASMALSFATGIQPESSIGRFEKVQAEFSRSSFLPANLEVAPRSGSQLYMQRLAALRAGKLYTRLPVSSFQEAWSKARTQPTHEQWRKLLALEARAVARGQGARSLSVLVGDSLSMWFPANRLPQNQLWLNQGISGETTRQILSRLSAFSRTRPDQIYVMAGINDLRTGATDTEVLWNLQRIVQRLRATHPNAKVIVQSILPTRSPQVSSQRIARINQQLEAIVRQEGASYLDLFSRFVAEDGQMIAAYTTDGIHLNASGYAAWQAAVQQTEVRIAQLPSS